jgi:hypothetical protein
MSAVVVRYRFTVDDYEDMIKFGILTKEDRVELLDGEIVEKMAIGDLHAGSVNRCLSRFTRRLGEVATGEIPIVAVQNPVRLPTSEPEPDLALLRYRHDYYATQRPVPPDIMLLVEVADSSLDLDRNIKGPLYARAGIAEYWILNLAGGVLEVHRDPHPSGSWGTVSTLRPGDRVECSSFAAMAFDVAELL